MDPANTGLAQLDLYQCIRYVTKKQQLKDASDGLKALPTLFGVLLALSTPHAAKQHQTMKKDRKE